MFVANRPTALAPAGISLTWALCTRDETFTFCKHSSYLPHISKRTRRSPALHATLQPGNLRRRWKEMERAAGHEDNATLENASLAGRNNVSVGTLACCTV